MAVFFISQLNKLREKEILFKDGLLCVKSGADNALLDKCDFKYCNTLTMMFPYVIISKWIK